MRPIETRYARSGDIRIAYQVVGQGSLDLVFVPGFISNLDLHWEDEGYSRLLRRLCGFSRVILFDKRGTGLSDRVDTHCLPSLEMRMDDVRAVMDAAGSGRAAILGASEGAPMAILFAATYPERTRALMLYGGYAHFHRWVMSRERLEKFVLSAETTWGTGATLGNFAPGKVDDPRFSAWWARFERLSASPTAAVALARMNAGMDVRGVLENIHVPSLLIHRKGDVRVDPEASRYLARKISGAKLVEIPGMDHPIWTGDVDRVADVIEDFLTGTHAESEIRRVLAVVLATRIGNGARLGDRMWDERCQDFHDTWRMIVARHGGRIVSAHGEVMVCRFEGPARAMHCAEALREAASAAAVTCAQGVHVGEIEPHGPLEGLTVRVAMRIAAQAGRDDILVSRLAADLAAGSGLHFTPAEPILLDELDHPLQLVEAKSEKHLEPVNHVNSRVFERDALTMRESEVVALIADGKSNAAIAAELRLSAHTVKRHVANILLKLDLPSRAAAAAFVARQSGPDEP